MNVLLGMATIFAARDAIDVMEQRGRCWMYRLSRSNGRTTASATGSGHGNLPTLTLKEITVVA